MAERGDSEGFGLTPPQHNGARQKDSYYPLSDDNMSVLKETGAEYKRVKSYLLRIARNHRRQNKLLKSESPGCLSPVYHRSSRRSRNLSKLKIANLYPTNVEFWFNQKETQFDLHNISDDDEHYRLTCAALSGEVASDVRDILLQPFRTHKYLNLKEVLIERRGLTMPERVYKVISGEKLGTNIPSRFRSVGSCRQGCDTPGLHLTDANFHYGSFGYTARQYVIGEPSHPGKPSLSLGKRQQKDTHWSC